MVAIAVLAIGHVAIGAGFQQATSGVAVGRGETTAVFLAEQRLEQLKAQALTNFTAVLLNAGTTTEYCAGAAACQSTAIANVPSYVRVTTITDVANAAITGCPVTPLSCKEVLVRVTYRPVTSSADLSQQRIVDVFATLSPRN